MLSVNRNQVPGASAPLAQAVAEAAPIARRLRVQLVVLTRNPDHARRKIDDLVRGAVRNATEATALLQALKATSSIDQVISGATAPGDAPLAPVLSVLQSILAPQRRAQTARPAPEPLRAPATPSATARPISAPATSGVRAVDTPAPPPFSVTVKDMMGRGLVLSVTADMTIEDLLLQHAAAEGFPLDRQALARRSLYRGSFPQPKHRTLRQCDIQETDKLEIYIDLRGD